MTARTARSRSGSSWSRGTRYGIRASLILRLARTSRWAMAGSPIRKARATSSVLRPPSSRRVSATWASRARAGWQQVKISRSRSSGKVSSTGLGEDAVSLEYAISACLAANVFARRRRSIALWRAVETSQARGLPGTPSRGHFSTATAKASCSTSSARSKSRRSRIRVARARGRSSRYSVSKSMGAARQSKPPGGVWRRLLDGRRGHDRTHFDRARARGRDAGGELDRLVEILGLDEVEAAQLLARLREGAVGGDRLAVLDAHGGRGRDRLQRLPADVVPALADALRVV